MQSWKTLPLKKMTLSNLRTITDPFLTPEQIAPILQVNPHSIRLAARENPKGLGFPVVVIGNRVKIPRKPFLEFIGEG